MRLAPPSIARLVQASCARPVAIVLVALALTVLAGWFAAGHFSMTSNTAELISPKVEWRQQEIAMDAAFPQLTDNIVVVVDGATPELAESGAAALTARLQQRTDVISTVRRPDGGPF